MSDLTNKICALFPSSFRSFGSITALMFLICLAASVFINALPTLGVRAESSPIASPNAVAPSLGQASTFAVLAGSFIANTGPSVVTGDIGVYPGSSITGFPPGSVVPPGTIHASDAVAMQAQSDATLAYNNLAGQACNTDLSGQDLGGLTLTPGVYCFASSASLVGTLTLNAQGNPFAGFIFQIGAAFVTASNSSIVLINGATARNVFFQVGGPTATIGTNTQFQGNILALVGITLNTGATLTGRAIARNGAVTLDTNRITRPQPATAATVSVSGRVLTMSGRGITGVVLSLTDSQGNTRTTTTTSDGYYRFDEVEAGSTYIITATGKRFSFSQPSQVLNINEETEEVNFIGTEQKRLRIF